jgi:endonuclease G
MLPVMRAAGLAVVLCAAAARAAAGPPSPRVTDPIGAAGAAAPIVGGHDATAGEWPDAAAVIVGGNATCGGVLVAPDVVVTAGHCCGDPGSTLDPPPDHVRVGALRLSDSTDGETIAVAQVIAHPNIATDLDVGVLILAQPATAAPRALATGWAAAEAHDGASAVIAGWGETTPTATMGSDVLQEAAVSIVEGSCTSTAVGCRAGLMPGGELRAGGSGMDTCGGDSGGPLYVAAPYGTFLAATTYAGYVTPGSVCGDGGIYERADRSIDWIEQAAVRTLPRAAGPVVGAYPIDAGSTLTAPITVNDPLPGAQHTFEIAQAPAMGTATVDDGGVITYVADGGASGGDVVIVRVHDASTPARAATAELDVSVAPTGCVCGAGGSARGAWLPAAIALIALRRRRSG